MGTNTTQMTCRECSRPILYSLTSTYTNFVTDIVRSSVLQTTAMRPVFLLRISCFNLSHLEERIEMVSERLVRNKPFKNKPGIIYSPFTQTTRSFFEETEKHQFEMVKHKTPFMRYHQTRSGRNSSRICLCS